MATMPEIQSAVSGASVRPQLEKESAGDYDQCFVVLGDSTGDAIDEFPRVCAGLIAIIASAAYCTYRLYDNTAGKYGAKSVLAIGAGEPYITVGADGRGWCSRIEHVGQLSDMDLRCDVALTDWQTAAQQSLVAQYGSVGYRNAFRFMVSNRYLGLEWVESDGTTYRVAWSSVQLTVSNLERKHVRVTFDPDNGAGGREVKFYTSSDAGQTWVQLGTTLTGAVSNLYVVPTVQNYELGSTGGPVDGMAGTNTPARGTFYGAHISPIIDGANKAPEFVRGWLAYTGMTGLASTGGHVAFYNGSIPGANMAYITAGDRLSRMCPRVGSAVVIVNTSHNEGPVYMPSNFMANYISFLSAVDTRVDVRTLYLVTQNPQIAPLSVTQQRSQRQRANLIPKIAADRRVNAFVCDTYPLFAGREVELLEVDGVHPNAAGKAVVAAKVASVLGIA
jgi:lysophospholipase L1-like esterase